MMKAKKQDESQDKDLGESKTEDHKPDIISKNGQDLDEDGKIVSSKKSGGCFERWDMDYKNKNKEAVYDWGRD